MPESETPTTVMRRLQRLGVVRTVESATTLERVDLVETVEAGHAIREAAGKTGPKGSVISVDVIRSGWNKSGTRYYSREVLERDVPKVYGAGTHMYLNHPSATDRENQPERTLQGLAAVFLEDPKPVMEADGRVMMRTTARVFSDYQGFLAERAPVIGVSINGGGEGEWGTAEGREGMVLEALTFGQSVDFVTKPGAGGRILALLESDQPMPTVEDASLGAWLESRIHLGFTQLADDLYGDGRLTREERMAASSAIGDALAVFVGAVEVKAASLYKRDRWSVPAGADTATREALTVEARAEDIRAAIDRALQAEYNTGADNAHRYAYVRDFDPDTGTVWYVAGGAGVDSRTWARQYTRTGDTAALVGDPVEVRERTVYEPVTAPAPVTAAAAAATTEALTSSPDGSPPAGSLTATEAATTATGDVMTTDVATREAAEAARIQTAEALELARYRVADTARGLLDTKLQESDLCAPAQARVRAGFPATTLPLVEADRSLNSDLFARTVEAAITAEAAYVASILEAAGAGRVAGNGAARGAGTGVPAAFGGLNTLTTEADAATVEALEKQYTDRGLSPEAARAAAAGRN